MSVIQFDSKVVLIQSGQFVTRLWDVPAKVRQGCGPGQASMCGVSVMGVLVWWQNVELTFWALDPKVCADLSWLPISKMV